MERSNLSFPSKDLLELAQLRSIPASDRTPAQTQRIAEIIEMQRRMQANFQQFLDSAEVQIVVQSLRSIDQLDPNHLTSLQDNLQQLEQKTVLLYPLALDDRLELILVAADVPPIRRSVPVSREEFNRAIATTAFDPFPPRKRKSKRSPH